MFDVYMYVDDTTLICDFNDIPLKNQSTVLNLKLEKVSNWLACNNLSLNTDKSTTKVDLQVDLHLYMAKHYAKEQANYAIWEYAKMKFTSYLYVQNMEPLEKYRSNIKICKLFVC